MDALKESDKIQCIVVTGQSGSGKTVTTHYLTHFLCDSSPNQKHITDFTVNANKLLDIFGNAETPENSNSSRFVKFLQVHQNIAIFF